MNELEPIEPLPPTETPPPAAPPRRPGWAFGALRELLETLLPAAIIAILVNLFLAQSTVVLGQSMETNLHENQRLITEKVSYWTHGPQRGDVVVLSPPPNCGVIPLIKRVVALPGERIEIRNGFIYIDGQLLDEPYITARDHYEMPAQVVPPMSVFVMGDNRGASNDSRAFGPIAAKTILGRAWISYWPLSELKVIR